MIKKELEKKIELVACDYVSDIENPIKLEYYLTESELHDFDEMAGKTVYGVEIVKFTEDNKTEVKSFLNLSSCKKSVKEILDKLADNTVTPIALEFVLDDLLGA